MPVDVRLGSAHLVSVYDDREPLRVEIPNVHPSKYSIPSIHATAADLKELCRLTYREPGMQPVEVQYAERKEQNGQAYVVLTVVEAKTFVQSPAVQAFDEYGQRMEPDIQRAALTVRAQEIANEIERAYGPVGIVAIASDLPTEEELREAVSRNLSWKRNLVEETTRWAARRGAGQITDQARRAALDLYKRGLIAALPTWADAAVGAKAEDVVNCKVCNAVLRRESVKCGTCGAIYDWKKAVEYGIKAPHEVPPDKRVEAGIESANPVSQSQGEPEDDWPVVKRG